MLPPVRFYFIFERFFIGNLSQCVTFPHKVRAAICQEMALTFPHKMGAAICQEIFSWTETCPNAHFTTNCQQSLFIFTTFQAPTSNELVSERRCQQRHRKIIIICHQAIHIFCDTQSTSKTRFDVVVCWGSQVKYFVSKFFESCHKIPKHLNPNNALNDVKQTRWRIKAEQGGMGKS